MSARDWPLQPCMLFFFCFGCLVHALPFFGVRAAETVGDAPMGDAASATAVAAPRDDIGAAWCGDGWRRRPGLDAANPQDS